MEHLTAKPILLIKIHRDYFDSYRPKGTPSVYQEINDNMQNKFDDYHVLVVSHDDNKDRGIKLEAFYPKDFDRFNFEQFKNKIEESLTDFSKQSQI